VVLGLDGEGSAERFADYSQWEEWREEKKRPAPKVVKAAETPVAAVTKKKLSYIEAREYDGMEAKIAEAEAELTSRKAALEDPAVTRDGRAAEEAYRKMEEAQASVDALYARWSELEAKLS
jgi:ATP-binding cassette subfamily F protein uup